MKSWNWALQYILYQALLAEVGDAVQVCLHQTADIQKSTENQYTIDALASSTQSNYDTTYLRYHNIHRDLTGSNETWQDLLRSQKIYWDLTRPTDLAKHIGHLNFHLLKSYIWHWHAMTWDDIWHLTSTEISQDLMRSQSITKISKDLLRSQKIYWFGTIDLTFDMPWNLKLICHAMSCHDWQGYSMTMICHDIWHLTLI